MKRIITITLLLLSGAYLYALEADIMAEDAIPTLYHDTEQQDVPVFKSTIPHEPMLEEVTIDGAESDSVLMKLIEAAAQKNVELEQQIAALREDAVWQQIYDISVELELNANMLQQLQDEQKTAIAIIEKYTQQ